MALNNLKGTQFDLTGKVAIVTGATKGMGHAIVRRFVQHGAKVAVSSRSQTDCDAVAKELNELAGQEVAIGVAADLLDIPSLQRLADRTLEVFKQADIVVCNAALQSFHKLEDIPDDEWADVVLANTRNNFRLCQRVLPYMRKAGGGSIILVGSAGCGVAASENMPVYGISKRAMAMMSDNMALTFGRDNIRVNVLAPGAIKTFIGEALWSNPQLLEVGRRVIPLMRPGLPDEIAGVAVFLASDAGSYTTGVTIPVDGGQVLVGSIADAIKVDDVLGEGYDRHGAAK